MSESLYKSLLRFIQRLFYTDFRGQKSDLDYIYDHSLYMIGTLT